MGGEGRSGGVGEELKLSRSIVGPCLRFEVRFGLQVHWTIDNLTRFYLIHFYLAYFKTAGGTVF